MMEMMLVLSQLLRRFEFRALNAHEVQHRQMITMGPDRALFVTCRAVAGTGSFRPLDEGSSGVNESGGP